ncbi:unnamed protein product [Choristocarpus tenellus]
MRTLLATVVWVQTAWGFHAPCSPLSYKSTTSLVRIHHTSSLFLPWQPQPRRGAVFLLEMKATGGPNSKEKSSFFAEWSVLEAELKFYLADREAGEPEVDAVPRSPVLEYLSIDPKTVMFTEDEEPEEWEGEQDVLAYSELSRYGYDYLVDPMMSQGGYIEASRRMGIPLKERFLKDKEYYERIRPPVQVQDEPPKDGFLTLGSALEQRIESVAAVDREQRNSKLFEKQAMMDKSSEAVKVFGVKKKTSSAASGPSEVDLKTTPVRGSATLVEPNVPPQPLTLSLLQRSYVVSFAACSAVGFGQGTNKAIELGLLPDGVVAIATAASLVLLGVNAASAVGSGYIANNLGRSVPLWVLKSALAGVTSVLELKRLGPLEGLAMTTGVSVAGDETGGMSQSQ